MEKKSEQFTQHWDDLYKVEKNVNSTRSTDEKQGEGRNHSLRDVRFFSLLFSLRVSVLGEVQRKNSTNSTRSRLKILNRVVCFRQYPMPCLFSLFHS